MVFARVSFRTLVKVLAVGVLTTVARTIGQTLLPADGTATLAPSVFVEHGLLPAAFTIYGTAAYSLIASLFLLISKRTSGNRLVQGFRFGLACAAIWVVYLLEPLPHVLPLDRITYPLADGVTLLLMGVLVGRLLGESRSSFGLRQPAPLRPVFMIALCFLLGRLLLYVGFGIYSSFAENATETIGWCLLTGSVVAVVLVWLNRSVEVSGLLARAGTVGGLLFGINLTVFNFFMPLVFDVGLADLVLRTAVDIAAVSFGCLFLQKSEPPPVS